MTRWLGWGWPQGERIMLGFPRQQESLFSVFCSFHIVLGPFPEVFALRRPPWGAWLAQSGEHASLDLWVVGSIPI